MSDLHIRWHIRRDLPEMLAIDAASYRKAWTEERFLACMRKRNCISMTAEVRSTVVGFMTYELEADRFVLIRLAVDPAWRFHGIGGEMVSKLVSKLGRPRREEVDAFVSERNVAGHLFLASHGFQCVGSQRSALLFRYKIPTLRETA